MRRPSVGPDSQPPSFFEFFAGAGMARAGLGKKWECLFANDFDDKKAKTYALNWGGDALKVEDVGALAVTDLPGRPDLAWASFPCQDLSLAGGGAGLRGDRSGTFWPFWKLMGQLSKETRAPRVVILENVCGTLTSHGGKDFAAICTAVEKTGYLLGAVVVDAALFVPQSRARLFIIAVRRDVQIPAAISADGPQTPWHTGALRSAHGSLPQRVKKSWVWWKLPVPPRRATSMSDIVEDDPDSTSWFTEEATQNLLGMMTPVNLAKVEAAQKLGRRVVGGVYKRTRPDADGRKVQRAEVRFDDVAGCLRTPAGGSSRQVIIVVHGNSVRARLISSRETARLMGLPDSYLLPSNYNEAYHLTGDGVVVPVVRHLARYIVEPIVRASKSQGALAA